MMKNKLLYIVFLLISCAVSSQEQQTVLGRVVSGDNGVGNVFVINKTVGTEVKTDYKGYFDLTAKPGDKLVVYNTKIIVREFTLTAESFKVSPYIISVNYKAIELDEVVIDKYSNINAESLGLVPKGQLKRTVAERRVYTAGTFSVGTVVALDPIINAISGRTRMLKRALATERQEGTVGNVQGLYSEEELIATYHIPKEHINGFLYYVAEDKEFVTALKAKNKQYIDFLMMELSKKYLKLQEDGK
jgi:hypothetical protein